MDFLLGGKVVTRAGCTIISPNYLPYARTLAASYMAEHPDQRFFVLIVADLTDPAPFQGDDRFTPVMLGEIGVPELRAAAMRYDILELNTNVKPTFLKYLLAEYALDALVYLDPDIFVYRGLSPVFAALEAGAAAVLTPHMTAPVFDGKAPSEQDLLYNGTYNLGFIAVSNSPDARRLLDWWEQRCLRLGFSEGRTGLFVDQKWMNLAPGLFADVQITRDPGLNMAYWNLHERRLARVGDGYEVQGPAGVPVPLRFFHFSGLPPEQPELISRNTDRFTLQERPDLRPLFANYREALGRNQGHSAEAAPYGFDRFSDGTGVTRLARRIFAALEENLRDGQPAADSGTRDIGSADPFDVRGPFFQLARQRGLIRGKVAAQKSTWKEFNPRDRRVQAVHRLLRWSLRLLGPQRYELLMRYLGHSTVLRYQAAFLLDPKQADSRTSR